MIKKQLLQFILVHLLKAHLKIQKNINHYLLIQDQVLEFYQIVHFMLINMKIQILFKLQIMKKILIQKLQL
jgi:hypothetical protein